MEHTTHRTPDHNGHHIDTMAVGVRVASRHQEQIDNVEIHYCRGRSVDTCTDRGHVKQDGTEWRNISTTHARHSGMVETMSRPLSFVADTTSATERENRKQTVRGHPVGLSGNIPTPDTKIIFASAIS
jgi:hypothetical protein